MEEIKLDDLLKKKESLGKPGKAKLTGFMQSVVFYSRPVYEELEITDKKMIKSLDGKRFVFPYYSSEIFMSEEDAANFIPLFINKLIEEKILPADVIKKNGQIDDTKCKCGIVPLQVTKLERKIDD